jgi:aminoglycoside phosphotransferase (APT) family kinase protein
VHGGSFSEAANPTRGYGAAVPEWDPDVVVDEALVRALVSEQFPELRAHSVRLVGEGFDNSVWVVDEQWAFRFPRRAIAVPLVAREVSVLPRVAPLLPAPVPFPMFVGAESTLFPRPFFGHRLLRGVEAAEAGLTDAQRASLGVGMGRFLRALHATATLEAADGERTLPVDPNRRAEMPYRVGMTRDRLGALEDLQPARRRRVEQILAEAEKLAPSSANVLLHGDLHVRHVLVEQGTLSGIIDWGDVCVGDPSIDLLFVWSALPPDARREFFEEYGAIGDETALRAQVLAIHLSAVLVLYARDQGLAALERETRAGLERALDD